MVAKIRLKKIRENYQEKGRVQGWMKILNITGRDISKCIGYTELARLGEVKSVPNGQRVVLSVLTFNCFSMY